jgi:hypothetical protein
LELYLKLRIVLFKGRKSRMGTMMSFFAVVLAATQIAVASPIGDLDTTEDYFPLAVGNSWWYSGDNGSHGGTTRTEHHRIQVVSKWDSLERTYYRVEHSLQEIITYSVPVDSVFQGPVSGFTSLIYEKGNEIFANRMSSPFFFHLFGIRAQADSTTFLKIGLHRFSPADSFFSIRSLPTLDHSSEDVPYFVRMGDDGRAILIHPGPSSRVSMSGGGGWLYPGIGNGYAPFDQVQIQLRDHKTQYSQSTSVRRKFPDAKYESEGGRYSGPADIIDLMGRKSLSPSVLFRIRKP